jgi:hypothetical protein
MELQLEDEERGRLVSGVYCLLPVCGMWYQNVVLCGMWEMAVGSTSSIWAGGELHA